tara:strand:+ start:592 stop:711 length:120 start_codon:yes stop_codon:yes gene_type:complete
MEKGPQESLPRQRGLPIVSPGGRQYFAPEISTPQRKIIP